MVAKPAKKRGRPPKVPAVVEKPSLPVAKKQLASETMDKLVLKGDLSGLTPREQIEYYLRFCEHLGLDPVTRPFDILNLKGKLVLYAHKGCTDQLRKKYGVSVTDLRGEMVADCYRVTALGRDHTGRSDAATGVVKVKGLTGDDFANATMKAETKAKRRLTLSLCGLGMLDESEIETIPGAVTVELDAGNRAGEENSNVTPRPASPAPLNKPDAEAARKLELEAARTDLNAIHHKLKASGLFTAEELQKNVAAAVASTDNLQSLRDLAAAWVDALNERKSKPREPGED